MSATDVSRLISAEVREGAILSGRYLIEHVLGTGGFGIVFAARHLALQERVAIKFLLPGALDDAAAMSRFEREAWAASKIKSEYVTRVMDVGRLDSGAPFIVMSS